MTLDYVNELINDLRQYEQGIIRLDSLEKVLRAKIIARSDIENVRDEKPVQNVESDINSFSNECGDHLNFVARLNKKYNGLNLNEMKDDLNVRIAALQSEIKQ